MDEKQYTVKQVAEQFQVSRQAVYDWIKDGRLRAIKLGNRTRISASAIDDFAQPITPGETIADDDD